MSLPFYLSYAALWALVVFQTLVVIGLVKTHGRGHELGYHEPGPAGNLTGEKAPDFEAEDVFGTMWRGGLLLGRTSALLFVSPECSTCTVTLLELEALKAKTDGNVIVICRADRDSCTELAREYDLSVPVIPDGTHTISDLFRVTASPTAVIVTADGHIGPRGHPMSAGDIERFMAEQDGQAGPPDLPEIVVAGRREDLTGEEMPAFETEDVSGTPLTSNALLGKPAMLLFTSPDCTNCEVTKRELADLTLKTETEPVIFCHAVHDRCASLAHYYESTVPVIADESHALHGLFGITTLPTVVLVGADGRIKSYRQLRELITSTNEDGDAQVEGREDELQRLVNEMRS
jgi:peroxiredoxin